MTDEEAEEARKQASVQGDYGSKVCLLPNAKVLYLGLGETLNPASYESSKSAVGQMSLRQLYAHREICTEE